MNWLASAMNIKKRPEKDAGIYGIAFVYDVDERKSVYDNRRCLFR